MKLLDAQVLQPNWGLDRVVGELRETRRRWRESCARNHECGGRELPT